MRKVVLAAFMCLATTGVAVAQDKPVDVNVGFGVALPVGALNDTFDTGWNGNAGVTFNFRPGLGIQGEYSYMRMGGPEKYIDVSPTPGAPPNAELIESNHQVHSGTFNLVAKSSGDGMVGGYGLGGFGVYHRTIQLTSPAVGYTTVCDPYWYVCYPALVEVDRILGDRSSTDFGINFGGAITFGPEAKFYIEARWHYIWGPKVTRPANGGQPAEELSTNAQYFPITFGVKW